MLKIAIIAFILVTRPIYCGRDINRSISMPNLQSNPAIAAPTRKEVISCGFSTIDIEFKVS